MKHCHYLLNEFYLYDTVLAPCCYSPPRDKNVPQLSYAPSEIDIDAYLEYIISIIDEIQNNHNICEWCKYLVETHENINAVTKDSIRFRLLEVQVNRHLCNCRCAYCDIVRTPTQYPRYDIDKFFDLFLAHPCSSELQYVRWVGGEPSLLPEYEPYMEKFRAAGLHQILLTNAIICSRPFLEVLADGQGSLLISLDCGTRETYEKIKGVDKFDNVIETIQKYTDAIGETKSFLDMKYIMFPGNMNFKDILGFMIYVAMFRTRLCHYTIDIPNTLDGKNIEQEIFFSAYLAKATAELGIDSMFVDYQCDKSIPARINSVDLEAWTAGEGYESFCEHLYSNLAETAASLPLKIPYSDIIPGEKTASTRKQLLDINTEGAFTKALTYLSQSYTSSNTSYDSTALNFIMLPQADKLDCGIDEYLFRKICITWNSKFSLDELKELRQTVPTVYNLDRLLRHTLQQRQQAHISAQAAELKGMEVLFWGAGAAYEHYKSFFIEAIPKAMLVDGRYANRGEIDRLPVLDPAAGLAAYPEIPIVVFTRESHSRLLVDKLNQLAPHRKVVLCRLD